MARVREITTSDGASNARVANSFWAMGAGFWRMPPVDEAVARHYARRLALILMAGSSLLVIAIATGLWLAFRHLS